MTKKHLSCVAYIALGVMGLVLIAVTIVLPPSRPVIVADVVAPAATVPDNLPGVAAAVAAGVG